MDISEILTELRTARPADRRASKLLHAAAVAKLNGRKNAEGLVAQYAAERGITMTRARAEVDDHLDLCLE